MAKKKAASAAKLEWERERDNAMGDAFLAALIVNYDNALDRAKMLLTLYCTICRVEELTPEDAVESAAEMIDYLMRMPIEPMGKIKAKAKARTKAKPKAKKKAAR